MLGQIGGVGRNRRKRGLIGYSHAVIYSTAYLLDTQQCKFMSEMGFAVNHGDAVSHHTDVRNNLRKYMHVWGSEIDFFDLEHSSL